MQTVFTCLFVLGNVMKDSVKSLNKSRYIMCTYSFLLPCLLLWQRRKLQYLDMTCSWQIHYWLLLISLSPSSSKTFEVVCLFATFPDCFKKVFTPETVSEVFLYITSFIFIEFIMSSYQPFLVCISILSKLWNSAAATVFTQIGQKFPSPTIHHFK